MEGQTERKDNRRTFSVSKAFDDVHKILDELPANEASRFICEAIKHYDQVKNNPNWMGDQFRRLISLSAELQTMLTSFGGNVKIPPSPFPVPNEQTGYGNPYMQHPFQYPNYQPMHLYAQPGMMPYETIQPHTQQPQTIQQPVEPTPKPVGDQISIASATTVTSDLSSDSSQIREVVEGLREIAVSVGSGAGDGIEAGDTIAVEKGERIPSITTPSSSEEGSSTEESSTSGKTRKKSNFARQFVNKSQGIVET